MRNSLTPIVLVVLAAACATPGKRTAIGAGGGAAAGAGVGAIVGGWKGAAIGAAVGGLAGGAVGNYLDKQAEELKEVAETTKRTKDGILVDSKSQLLFTSDSAVLKPQAVEMVAKLGDILAKYPEDPHQDLRIHRFHRQRRAQRGALPSPRQVRARRPPRPRGEDRADADRGHGPGAADRQQQDRGRTLPEPSRGDPHRRPGAGRPAVEIWGHRYATPRANSSRLARSYVWCPLICYSNILSTDITCTSASPFAPSGNVSISLSVASWAAGFSGDLPLASRWYWIGVGLPASTVFFTDAMSFPAMTISSFAGSIHLRQAAFT